jgi:uncharacterized protein YeaO (DUF488 family)
MIRIKRVYEPPAPEDGVRLLVDRLWPRGVSKDAAALSGWLREVAPSLELRRWFGHDPARWDEFRRRYGEELRRRPEAWQPIAQAARRGDVTLLYGARDPEHNNAEALREFLARRGAEDEAEAA